jgi:putative MFS transporter
MRASPRADAGQAHPVFFWLGTSAVTLGVAFHLPMYIDAAAMNFHLAGMPFDWRMLTGMALIGGGTAAGWYGLLPAARMRGLPNAMPAMPAAPEATGDAGKLRWVHWRLLLVLALALIIDSMKASPSRGCRKNTPCRARWSPCSPFWR